MADDAPLPASADASSGPLSEPLDVPISERLSRATAGRLSLYLRRLEEFEREGLAQVSSRQLGAALGLTDAQVRRDLSSLGTLGRRGIGYRPQALMDVIRRTLGLDRQWRVALVGVGHLAQALLRYRGFEQRGFRFVALFDVDPAKIGQRLEDLIVHSLDRMPEVIDSSRAELGVIAVPADAAQATAEALVVAGIRGILNFAPAVLQLPPTVSLVPVDLAMQLEQLAFRVQLASAAPG